MSKGKKARFNVRSREKVLKRGMMDYCITGEYKHFVAGDAILTDERFFFGAELPSGEYLSFEFPLSEIYAVEKIGVPFFTQSMRITTDGKQYRLNATFVRRWVKAIDAARSGAADRKN